MWPKATGYPAQAVTGQKGTATEAHGAGGWRALARGAAGQGDSQDAVRAHARPVTQGDLPPCLITLF